MPGEKSAGVLEAGVDGGLIAEEADSRLAGPLRRAAEKAVQTRCHFHGEILPPADSVVHRLISIPPPSCRRFTGGQPSFPALTGGFSEGEVKGKERAENIDEYQEMW